MSKLRVAAALAACVAPLAFVAPAQAAVKVGMLTCNVAPGAGFIVGSSKAATCRFDGPNGIRETYTGSFKKFGVDIGATQNYIVKWGVFAPSSRVQRGALAGTYAGATGSATFGVGAGANVLVGGSNRSFTLQPVSASVQTGLNVAAGIGELRLNYVPAKSGKKKRK